MCWKQGLQGLLRAQGWASPAGPGAFLLTPGRTQFCQNRRQSATQGPRERGTTCWRPRRRLRVSWDTPLCKRLVALPFVTTERSGTFWNTQEPAAGKDKKAWGRQKTILFKQRLRLGTAKWRERTSGALKHIVKCAGASFRGNHTEIQPTSDPLGSFSSTHPSGKAFLFEIVCKAFKMLALKSF